MTLGKAKNVLEDDTYLDDLDFIITRDFFPDSEMLELQLKYFDAMDSQDFCAVKEIQMKLNRINETFESTRNVDNTSKLSPNPVPYRNPSAKEERDLPLNEYLAKNTSEDSFSYSELQRKTIERQMDKLSWSFKAAKEYNESKFRALESNKEILLSITDGTETDQIDKSDNNNNNLRKHLEYKVFNPVFFNPDNVALSSAERIVLAGKKSEIVYENTRFKTPLNIIRTRPKTNQIKTKVPGKIGHDGKELSSNGTPRVAGFSILGRMDTPGGTMTPRTTWGEIDDTPMEIYDSPMISRFRIQEPSEREKLANEMASKASRKYKNKKQQALDRMRSNLNRPNSSSRSIVSPAGIKLLARLTPSTPKSIISSRPSSTYSLSVKSNTPSLSRYGATPNSNSNNPASITDNLLDI